MRSRYMAEGVFVAAFRGSRTGVNQTTSARPTADPMTCAVMKPGAEAGAMPANVSVKSLASRRRSYYGTHGGVRDDIRGRVQALLAEILPPVA